MQGEREQHPVGQAIPEGVALRDIVVFLRRNAVLIGGMALATAVVTTALVLLLVPPRYRASATLVVVPPTFSSNLKPPTPTIQAYQKLLESDAVVSEVAHELTTKGVLDKAEPLRLGAELETRIFVSRDADKTALSPMLELSARSRDPEHAAAIVNTWADVFLARNRKFMQGMISPTIQLIEEQYTGTRKDLEGLEKERAATADRFQEQEDRLANDWDEKMAAYRSKIESRVVAFQAETRKSFEALAVASGREPSGQTIAVESGAGSESETELALSRLVVVRLQLAQTPQILNLEKSISDDALWQALVLTQTTQEGTAVSDRLQPLLASTIVSQEVNPLYTELSSQAAHLEMSLQGRQDSSAPRDLDLVRSLESLQRERSSGLRGLFDERDVHLAILDRSRRRDLEALGRERDTTLTELNRDLNQKRALLQVLSDNYNQAVLQKAQQNIEDIRLGTAAVPPRRPEPRRLWLKAALAAFLGALLGLIVALGLKASSW